MTAATQEKPLTLREVVNIVNDLCAGFPMNTQTNIQDFIVSKDPLTSEPLITLILADGGHLS